MYEAGSRYPGSQCEQTITQRGGLRRISPGSDADLAKRKAAESAALKLGWNKLEERVGESCSLISIKIGQCPDDGLPHWLLPFHHFR